MEGGGGTRVIEGEAESCASVKLLRVTEVKGRAMRPDGGEEGIARAGDERIIDRAGDGGNTKGGEEDGIKRAASSAADDELSEGSATAFGVEQLCLIDPRSVFGDSDVEIILEGERDGVLQAELELAVLNQVIDFRGIDEIRGGDKTRRIGREDVWERALVLRIVVAAKEGGVGNRGLGCCGLLSSGR